MVKKNEEDSRGFNFTPLAILLAGAVVVGASAYFRADDQKIAYPGPVEEEVAVTTPEVPVAAAPEAVTPAPAPVEEAKPEPAPEVSVTEPGIEWPVVKEEPKVELPVVVVEAKPEPKKEDVSVAKPKKKKLYPKKVVKKDDTAQDVFANNFMRGTGF